MIAGVKGGLTALTCSNPYRWLINRLSCWWRWSNLFWPSVSTFDGLSTERSRHRLRLTPVRPKRSNTEVMLTKMFIVYCRCWFRSRLLRVAGGLEIDSSGSARVVDRVTRLWRLLERSRFGWYSSKSHLPLLGFPRMLRLPVCSTTRPGLIGFSVDWRRPTGEESSASSSRVGWVRAPRNSLKVSVSIRIVSVKFWTLSMRVLVCRTCIGPAKCFENQLGQPCAVVLHLVACKREAPRSKGHTSRMSTKGTPMLKSVSGTDEQVEKQSFGKEKIVNP
ncbi:hypothetical protein TIFTF001_036689 [Ficus carica]|uniref:Uncharacterized protein n=1 Tax=Ficus carica TaxID=3494 RepID=A0AA88E3W6_FICCA|nr:hypothetical protein TIFTF001_036689 [Ficus carica]